MTVYLTLKLNFNIKQQQMASPEGRQISLNISYNAECVHALWGQREGDEKLHTQHK